MASNPASDPALRSRLRRRAAALAAAVFPVYATLLILGNSGPVRRAIQARASAALARVLPGARLAGEPGLDWRFRIGLGSLEVPGGDGRALLRVERVEVTPRWLALLSGRAEAETVRLLGARADLPGIGELPPVDARVRPGPPLLAFADLPGGGQATLRLERRGSAEADLRLSLEGAVIDDPRLAAGPVGPVQASLSGRLRWDAEARGATLSGGRLSLGPVTAALTLSARARPEPSGTLSLRAERVAWPDLVAALPAQLRPAAAAPRLAGTLSFHLVAGGLLARPEAWKLEAALDLAGLRADGPVALLGPFDFQAPESAGVERVLHLGPGSPSFVPLEEVPQRLVGAVLLAEDAGFWGHHGFDFGEIREALAERADNGRSRGASTLTQQLAKNLYLSGERTLARKIREALATLALEATVPKRRLLEIYLNIAEWGPGLFGIGEASRHYFGIEPRDLDAHQAAFLASIIPSPVRFHGYFTKGAVTPAFEERIRTLLGKMAAGGVISQAELAEAEAAPLRFAHEPLPLPPGPEGEAAPP